uniref:Tetraspanin n=1 Tax=Phallusia mammillata TaxID=59560 RepID=A0A6F9DV35_9ASCI|nr:tetraspanin-18-like [Phallusia mammillata]
MEGCGMKCLKYTMFIFNFIFFLAGGALLGLGIWAAVDSANFMQIVSTNSAIFDAVYVIIAVGAALLIISFLGCCGAIQENKCLLGTFFGIVLIIFIVEIVGGILVFVFYPKVTEQIVQSINQFDDTANPKNDITVAWDTTQTLFQCCGFNSPGDWRLNTAWTKQPNYTLPMSCCKRDLISITGNFTDLVGCKNETVGSFNNIGCEATLKTAYWIVGGVCLGVLAVELLALIFTCCLYRSVDK